MLKYLRRKIIIDTYLRKSYVLTTLFSIGLWQVGAWATLELLGFNLLFSTRNYLPHPSWDSRIVVIGIDDATLRQYGQFPLSRDRYTQLLETLEASPPATIGFDILFTEPTSYDEQLAEAMAINGQVVLPVAPSLQQQTLRLVPILDDVTAKGHIAKNADVDGVTRQLSLYIKNDIKSDIKSVPAFSMALLEQYNNSLQQTFSANSTKTKKSFIKLPPLQSGVNAQPVLINWLGPTQGIPTYSFIDVVEKKVDTAKLKNKIVLVGLTATGANDPLKTPFDQIPPASGVYLHAAVIDNILNNRLLQKLPTKFEILLLFAVGIGSSLILIPLKFQERTLFLGLLPITWFGVTVLGLTISNLWLPTAAPIGTILLAGLSIQWQEQKEKQQLMSLFARHVSQETAELIWNHRDEIFQNGQLDAKEMVATVLFTDIRSFTTISEGMKPRDLLNWLNSYLGAMAECIQQHHGVVDKYIGDAIMAVFGIPFPHTHSKEIQQDAIDAVLAAISMQERLVVLNQELKRLGKPTISIGIGIHTGLVVAGSIGGSQRLNYSVLGDAVNIAARLEQLNKNAKEGNPYSILVSETTFELIKQHFHTQQIQQLQLRGRKKITMVYSITGNKRELDKPSV
ncbi:CHASE2 domain-containing protein [Trichormus variabilis]|uniref:Adenylate/guanylate cyclase domain-containing protein n=1 Tax=Trichormus variabilis SAG 1403-4b TaxID=447716 RepID=A0A433V1R0_ANAVA|nr:adenylate/guanylate cyclase domain-containing protein [Trichormus variabilis]MBD2627180.1 adenylate/guanylate cyclase domain-containing protein [Trichormus variabilis FACHB-164]RUT00027.1 adenylate/guanylate cyclase domain-containing protein [Trichormus variabilis SAG 1403-4b]